MMRKAYLMMAAALAAVGLTLSAVPDGAQHTQTRITEDDPRWDCHTMGNKICGPGRG